MPMLEIGLSAVKTAAPHLQPIEETGGAMLY